MEPHPERMPDEDDWDTIEALTRAMLYGIGPSPGPRVTVVAEE